LKVKKRFPLHPLRKNLHWIMQIFCISLRASEATEGKNCSPCDHFRENHIKKLPLKKLPIKGSFLTYLRRCVEGPWPFHFQPAEGALPLRGAPMALPISIYGRKNRLSGQNPESHFSKHYYFKLLSFQATIVQINVIRRGSFAAPRRKMTKNRLRFGRHFSFLSDFLAVRLAAQENQRISGDAWKGRCPSTFNPQKGLCPFEERLWRFLYQFTAVKIGFPDKIRKAIFTVN